MNPHQEPTPDDFARQLSEHRRMMRDAQLTVYYAHSRTGLLARFVQRLADSLDPTGEARRQTRRP